MVYGTKRTLRMKCGMYMLGPGDILSISPWVL
jgi:hypothetical protein